MRNFESSPHAHAGGPGARGRSTLRDIAHRALADVGTVERDRIWLALENPRSFLSIDADLLSSSLSHLIRRSMRANASQVLLRARTDERGTSFSVFSDDQRSPRSDAATESAGALSGTLETVALLGGSLSVRHTADGHLHACIHIPAAAQREARS